MDISANTIASTVVSKINESSTVKGDEKKLLLKAQAFAKELGITGSLKDVVIGQEKMVNQLCKAFEATFGRSGTGINLSQVGTQVETFVKEDQEATQAANIRKFAGGGNVSKLRDAIKSITGDKAKILNKKSPSSGNTALHWAVQRICDFRGIAKNYLEIIEVLIQNGADLEIKGENEKTPCELIVSMLEKVIKSCSEVLIKQKSLTVGYSKEGINFLIMEWMSKDEDHFTLKVSQGSSKEKKLSDILGNYCSVENKIFNRMLLGAFLKGKAGIGDLVKLLKIYCKGDKSKIVNLPGVNGDTIMTKIFQQCISSPDNVNGYLPVMELLIQNGANFRDQDIAFANELIKITPKLKELINRCKYKYPQYINMLAPTRMNVLLCEEGIYYLLVIAQKENFPKLGTGPLIQIGPATPKVRFCCYDHVFRGVHYNNRKGVGGMMKGEGEFIQAAWATARIESLKKAGILSEVDSKEYLAEGMPGKKTIILYYNNDGLAHSSIQDDRNPTLHRHKMANYGMFLCKPKQLMKGTYISCRVFCLTEKGVKSGIYDKYKK